MSDAMLAKLSTIDLATIVALIVLGSVIHNLLNPLIDKFKKHIISKHKKEMRSESISAMVQEDHKRIETYEQNRVHDREQSFRIQQELTDAIKAINTRLDTMQKITDERFEESKAREEKRVRAQLKDRISQCYRYHHISGKWTSMEKESLEDLIEEYEAAGGENSFVHSKVQKEMYTWEVIPDRVE